MKHSHTIVLLMVVIVLVGVLFWTKTSEYTVQPPAPPAFENFAKIKPDAVQEIQLRAGESEVSIVRNDDGWTLPKAWGYPASKKKIEDFLKAIATISSPEERALSKESHAGFEVDAAKGRQVELKGIGDGLPARIIFGKMQGANQFFARLPDSETVYAIHMKAGFAWNLRDPEVKSKDWFDLVYLKPPEKGKVAAITMVTPDGEIQLKKKVVTVPAKEEETPAGEEKKTEEKTEEIWEVISPEVFVADENAVRSLTGRGEREQTASDAIDPGRAAELKLDTPERRVTFLYESGESVTLHFARETPPEEAKDEAPKERFFVRREGDRKIFEIQTWGYEGFFKNLTELKPKPKEEEPKTEPPPENE